MKCDSKVTSSDLCLLTQSSQAPHIVENTLVDLPRFVQPTLVVTTFIAF